MKLIKTRMTNLNLNNNVADDTELELEIKINYQVAVANDGQDIALGTINVDIQDINEKNEYPFNISAVFQGVVEFIKGEEIKQKSFALIYEDLRNFIKNFSRSLGYSEMQLPDIDKISFEEE